MIYKTNATSIHARRRTVSAASNQKPHTTTLMMPSFMTTKDTQ